jgi:hypothetical protein
MTPHRDAMSYQDMIPHQDVTPHRNVHCPRARALARAIP